MNEFKQAYTAVFLPSPACRADLSPRDLNHFPLLLCVKSHSLTAQKRGLCAVAVEFSSWSFKPTAGTADSQGTSRIHPGALLAEQNLRVRLDRNVAASALPARGAVHAGRCHPCSPEGQLNTRNVTLLSCHECEGSKVESGPSSQCLSTHDGVAGATCPWILFIPLQLWPFSAY